MKLVRIIVTSITAIAAVTTVGIGVSSARHRAALAPTTAYGWNFLIESLADTAFCIEVQSGNTEGRTLSLQQCGTVDNQRWTFTKNADATNVLIDSIGMCVNGRFRGPDLPLRVNSCWFGAASRFAYTPEGWLQNVSNGKCLAITGAASGAPILLRDCDANAASQKWTLGH